MEPGASHSQASSTALMPPPDLSQPTTPQPVHASLLDSSLSPGMPSASSAMDRAKYTSPAPPRTSSMTPPPSSQLPALLPAPTRSEARTPTSPTPQLESPPPTDRQILQLENAVAETSGVVFTSEQIAAASPDELRTMINELAAALRNANMSSAHYRLQFNMASVESEEAQKRMQVELDMAQREVEVLQEAEQRRRNSTSAPPMPAHQDANAQNALINELTRQCQMLQIENEHLTEGLIKAQRNLDRKDGQIQTLMEEKRILRERIRKNREHFNNVMQNAGVDQSPTFSAFGTPATPRNPNARRSTVSDAASRSQQPFEALLLADKMLSQETSTAPSTPTRSAPAKNRFGHTRGTHSMSSLPSTPNRSRPLHSTIFSTPPTFNAINHIPMSAPPVQYQQPKRIRRESSDSTITASSVDDNERFSEKDEVPESQAASAASSMLRRTPHSSFDGNVARKSASALQAKLFGSVKKPGIRPAEHEKKRVGSQTTPLLQGSPAKKGRVGDSVGLGIGGIVGSGRA